MTNSRKKISLRMIFLCAAVITTTFPGDVQSQVRHNEVGFSPVLGHLSLVDDLISAHQYSGALSGWGLRWSTADSTRINSRRISYIQGNRISNYTVAAHIQDFSLYNEWLFQSARFQLFSRECTIYLGPTLLLFFHYRNQEIGRTPLESSVLGMASVNFSNRITYIISSSFHFNTDVRVSVFSYGGKTSENNHARNPALMSALAATDFSAELNLRWIISEFFSTELRYAFRWMQVTKWDYFNGLTDAVSIQMGIRF